MPLTHFGESILRLKHNRRFCTLSKPALRARRVRLFSTMATRDHESGRNMALCHHTEVQLQYVFLNQTQTLRKTALLNWEARIQQDKPAMFPCLQCNSVGAARVRLSANTLYLHSRKIWCDAVRQEKRALI